MPHLPLWAAAVWRALWTLLLNPLLYLGVALQVWEHLRWDAVQRRQFGVRLPSLWRTVPARWLAGVIGGAACTIVLMLLGVTVPLGEGVIITVVALIATAVRPGGMAATAVIPGVILLATVARWLVPASGWHAVPWLGGLRTWHTSGWLCVAALAAAAEAILLQCFANRPAHPLAVRSRRGKPVGALLAQRSFVLPVAFWSPAAAGLALHAPHPIAAWHWPWFADAGLFLTAALPLWVGASYAAIVEGPPAAQGPIAQAAWWTALVAAAGAVAARWWTPLAGVIAAVLLLAIRAFGYRWQRRRQWQREPLYVPHPGGVRVLATVPGALADKLGLRAGEVIVQANQTAVHTAYDLHFALDQNPAYVRMHVLDVRGELRIVGGAVYAGERHQLGLVPVPEGREPMVQAGSAGLFASLRWPRQTVTPDPGSAPPASPDEPPAAPSAAEPI